MRSRREPILNLPPVVTALIAILTLLHFALDRLPQGVADEALALFALVPVRLSYALAPGATLRALAESAGDDGGAETLRLLLGDPGGAWLTPLTYGFLHGDWTHLAVNVLSLAAFGAPVARRFGDGRFLAFLAVASVSGAAAYVAAHALDAAPVIGASAAISGTMGAVTRFAFMPGAPLGERRVGARGDGEAGAGSTPLIELASNRRAAFFVVVWFGVNLMVGMFPDTAGVASAIAWEAHMGGFVAGLLLFGLFDPAPRRASE